MRWLSQFGAAALAASAVLFCSMAWSADPAPVGEATAAHADSHGSAAHGDGHDTSVPLTPAPDLVVWTIVTFCTFLFVLKKMAWKPLIDGLDKREGHYAKLLADAQADRDRATAMLADYEQKLKAAQSEVQAIIAEARRDAETTRTDIIAAAQAEADRARVRAVEDITRARDQAVNELFSHMQSAVLVATERVLSRSLSEADCSRLVDEALSEVSAR